MIRFYIVPDMLANAPMYGILPVTAFCLPALTQTYALLPACRFKRAAKGRGIGTARGRATIQRAQSKLTTRSFPFLRLY